MDVNQHYATLLGLGAEWTVSRVNLDMGSKRIDVYVDYLEKSAICPECGALAGIHDRMEERVWRHLDTMQFATMIHARTPRVTCPRHGVKVVELPWATKNSRFTLLFEAFAIDVLKAARSVKDAQRLLRPSWCQTHSIMCAAVERGMSRRRDLMRAALQTGKAWGLKELFGTFWNSADKRFAQANFTFWYEQVVKSGIKPMIKVANTLKRHLYGLLAWFDSMIDNAMAEGLNSKIQSLKAAARGFRNFDNFRTSILFFCGKLDMHPDFVRIGAAL